MNYAIVEMTKNTKYKYEVDKETGVLTLDRIVKTHVPFNYGYIPNTLSEDGDPLDVFIVSNEPIPPLAQIPFEILGVINCSDKGLNDEKLIVRIKDDTLKTPNYMAEIKYYLNTYKDGIVIKSVEDNSEAGLRILNEARERYGKT